MKSKLAINGGEKAVNIDRPHYVWPPITERIRKAVLRQLEESISIYDRSGIIKILEDKFAQYHGKKHALLTNSGTSALHSMYVGAVIQRDSSVLLLKRPKDDFMGGIYELPSGRVEDEESLDIALHREVEEETGLRIREIKRYLGHFDYKSKSGKKTRQFNFIVAVGEPLEIKLQEHDYFVWVDKNQLQQYPVTDSVKQILDSLFRNI